MSEPPSTFRSLRIETVERLRGMGLWVHEIPPLRPSKWEPEPFPIHGGALIAKPVGVPGNAVHEPMETRAGPEDEPVLSDMTLLDVRAVYGGWTVEPSPVWVPGPSPGHFREAFTNEDDLIAIARRYFFEPNPSVVAQREAHLWPHRARIVGLLRAWTGTPR